MEHRVEALEKATFGNGRKGLCDRMTINEGLVHSMNDDISSLATSFSALSKAMLEHDITEKLKTENEKAKLENEAKHKADKNEFREKLRKSSVLVISIIAIATPITALILNYKP